MFHFLSAELPHSIRQNAFLFLISFIIFTVTLIISFVYVQYATDSVYLLYGENQIRNFMYMYDPEHIKLSHSSSEHTTRQFLFYIFNNCWIGIKIFLGGFLLGLGALALLIFNALSMGLLMGFLFASGYGSTLWPTIIGHSSFELLATMISATAGFRLGWSMIESVPSALPRIQHIIQVFKHCLRLMYGSLVLFILAGLIEAFWSSNNTVPDIAKYLSGGLFWILLPTYLMLAGRSPVKT